MKTISDLNRSLRARYFVSGLNERTSFASRARAFEGARLLSCLNVLLTRKLPTFLLRLNEISGGCEKIAPVSGSFCGILKLLRVIAFTGLL